MNPWLYVLVVAASFGLSAGLVALSIKVAPRLGSVDPPDGIRKTQTQPVPLLGGVAVAIAFSAMLLGVALVAGQAAALPSLLGVLVPAVGIAILGLVDDRRDLSPWLRLGLQASLAGVAWFMGTRIEVSHSSIINFVLFVVWVVAVVNALNLLDNSDGAAGAVTLVIATSCALIAMYLGQYLVAALAWALAGVCGGFLLHNWYPAKVYLGDSGAYFLGFLLAVISVRLRPVTVSADWSVLVPMLLLGVPLIDLAFVVLRRLASGVHPFTAGRDHISHSLQRRGLRVPNAVAVLAGGAAVTCCAGAALVAFTG